MTARFAGSMLLKGALAAGLTFAGPLAAQGQRTKTPPEQPASGGWSPPAMTFADNRITLLEAVRLTLANDPTIRLQEQRTRLQEGAYQSATGQFDSTIGGSFSYLLTQQALRLSQLSAEKTKRDSLDNTIAKETARNDQDEKGIKESIAELGKLAADPDNYKSQSPQLDVITIQVQVDSLNRQIAKETNPLKRDLLIQQRNAIVTGGLISEQQKLFELRDQENLDKDNRRKLGDIPNTEIQQSLTINLTARFPQRNGVTLGLIADGSWDRNRYKDKDKLGENGGLGIEDLYKYSVGFTLDAALLRGRGVDATGAFETSAKVDWDASELALKHAASTAVLNTVISYWSLVAAQEFLDIATKSTGLHNRRLEITKGLIAGDEIPRAELSRALASQAQDEALMRNAERSLHEARVALATAMGLTVLDDANAPLAADPFPVPPAPDALSALKPSELLPMAIDNRYDRKASLRLVDSGGVLLRAAETQLRPRLDLTSQITANTVAETSLTATSNGWSAPSAQLGLQFEKPIGNNSFKGAYLQSQADLATRRINAIDLERTIKANVVQILYSLRSTVDQIERVKEAVRLYGETIETENEKFRLGQTALLDAILTQDLQTSALFTFATAKSQYATLLARLRFETGTLVSEAGGRSVVGPENLLNLPGAKKK